jgi:tripartite-type tricarboxylate transporter receptor subunit TctC
VGGIGRNLPGAIEHIRNGKINVLAVTASERADTLPDIPTVAEFVPGYEASAWFGIGAPRGTPPDIVETLNRGINAALVDPKMRARFMKLGGMPIPGSATALGALIAEEVEKWSKVIRTANIKAE